MRAEDLERSSVMLLEDLRDRAAGVVARLDPGERERLRAGLAALAERAGNVRTPAEKLALVDDVHRLVEDIPPLREWLLAPGYDVEARRLERSGTGPGDGNRSVLDEDDEALVDPESHAQEFAAFVRNLVGDAGEKIAEVMARDQANDDERGQ